MGWSLPMEPQVTRTYVEALCAQQRLGKVRQKSWHGQS